MFLFLPDYITYFPPLENPQVSTTSDIAVNPDPFLHALGTPFPMGESSVELP